MSRCLQEPYYFHAALEDHGQHVNFNTEFIFAMLRAKCPLDIGISDKQLEMGASSLEVRASMLMLSTAIDSVAPPPARGHASEGPRQHLSLRATFQK